MTTKLTLYRAYELKGTQFYTLQARNGRPPGDFQIFALVDDKLFFDWPHDM